MIRRGRFARWNGKEYELHSSNRQIYLMTKDPDELQNGFLRTGGSHTTFYRKTDVRELEDAYEIVPYAILRGHRFAIEGVNAKTRMIKLVTTNMFAAKKVDVYPYGDGMYMIELPLEDVEIEEDRIAILGFENRYV